MNKESVDYIIQNYIQNNNTNFNESDAIYLENAYVSICRDLLDIEDEINLKNNNEKFVSMATHVREELLKDNSEFNDWFCKTFNSNTKTKISEKTSNIASVLSQYLSAAASSNENKLSEIRNKLKNFI